MSRQLRTPIGTNQEVEVGLIKQDRKEVVGELEEDGALTVAVGLITLHFAGGNASNSAIELELKVGLKEEDSREQRNAH